MLLSTHSLRRLCALWAVVCTPIWTAPLYVASSLGTLPPGFSSADALGLNNKGAVVGIAAGTSGVRGFLSQNGTISILDAGSSLSSGASDINDAGQVIGFRAELDSSGAVTWINGVVQALPTLPGSEAAPPYAINNLGNVVGSIGDRGVIYRSGGAGSIEVIPAVEFVLEMDINDSNQVAGTNLIGGTPQAFLYSNGTVQNLSFLPGGFFNGANALNNAGQVVGFSDSTVGTRGFMYSSGTLRMVEPVGYDAFASEMFGINNRGIAVGISRGFDSDRALLYANGRSYDLNARLINSGWELSEARAINDSGQILGVGRYQGNTQAFLLTPRAVPEPQTAALVSATIALMLVGRRWRRRE